MVLPSDPTDTKLMWPILEPVIPVTNASFDALYSPFIAMLERD